MNSVRGHHTVLTLDTSPSHFDANFAVRDDDGDKGHLLMGEWCIRVDGKC